MKTLHLNLKKKWFDMFLTGVKKEEYRELKQFWVSRLVNLLVVDHTRSKSHLELILTEDYDKAIFNFYDTITFSNGYTKDRPLFVIELKGIEIREGKAEWGAEPGKKYFVLKTGEILSGGISWQQVEQAERHGHSTEYFIDGYINGEKKYEAIGSYTVAGNELEEIRDVERV